MSGIFSRMFASRRASRHKVDRKLLSAICKTVSPGGSIVDVGCGSGDLAVELQELGYYVTAIDGVVPAEAKIAIRPADLSLPLDKEAFADVVRRWAICIEVGEHIPADRESVFLDNLCWLGPKGVICSWALPGQRGRGHVNCLDPHVVAARICDRGFYLDWDATSIARGTAGDGWDKKLLVLRKVEAPQ
jgi:SAM-dependent methyltransferase